MSDPLQEAIERLRLAQQFIDAGYRRLAKELHPDRGGTLKDMARLNRVRERLQQAALSTLSGREREWKYRPFPKAWEKF